MTQREAAVGSGEPSPTALRAAGIVKAFAGLVALRGVDFDLRVGEIHALVGENGAGKSTLAKIISGAYAADEGTLWADGKDLPGSLRRHAEAGIAMVYQEPKLVPGLTATENVFLAKPFRYGPFVARQAEKRRLAELADAVGIEIEPRARAGELTLAKQRMLDVIHALDSRARILIMDEPSAALGPVERESLYRTLARLRETQVTILYISHDLDEVFRLADRISVMRDGSLVATKPAGEWTKQAVVEAMLGRDFVVPKRHRVIKQSAGSGELLRVEGLTVPGALAGIDLTLGEGEVLGIAGLVGSGRSTLLRALAGAEPQAHGRLVVQGREVPWPRTVRQALRTGIALSPEDRRRYGLVLGMSGASNVALANLRAVSSGLLVRQSKIERYAERVVSQLAFDPTRLRALAGTLSGGNQQKLVVGRTLGVRPKILLLDEPTAGIDVGAKAEMFTIIDRLASEGLSVLFASSELEEVVEISDRILIIGQGRSLAVLEAESASVHGILRLVFGADR